MRCDYDETTLAARTKTEGITPRQNVDINDIFFKTISQYLKDADSLLDIGTGNGFVLSEIVRRNPQLKLKLCGVDNSAEMVMLAKKNLMDLANIEIADADYLPFGQKSFDVVTAKNVTRINAEEAYRVLKPGGIFVFREYGPGKGLCEIASLFPGRIIRQREPQFYIDNFVKAGFSVVNFKTYEVIRHYDSPKDLVTIAKSFPFIENFSESDAKLIIRTCHNANVTSDPFILICRKEK